MQVCLGKIAIVEDDINKWRLFGFHNSKQNTNRRLPLEVLHHCLSYDKPRYINAVLSVDNDSFKYTFLDEEECPIMSSPISVKAGQGSNCLYIIERDSKTYGKYYRGRSKRSEYTFITALNQSIHRASLLQLYTDFLTKSHSLSPIFMENLQYFYKEKTIGDHMVVGGVNYYIRPECKLFPQFSDRVISNDIISFNINWGFLNVITEFITRERHATEYIINIFNDLDGVTQWVAVYQIRKMMSHTDTNQALRKSHSGVEYEKDYKRRRHICFENERYVHKHYRSKDTWFLKVTSLPKFLVLSHDFEYKVLALWVLKHLLHSENR